MSQKNLGLTLLGIALIIFIFIAYKNSSRRQVPIIFSPRSELIALWEEYKKLDLEPDTYRVLDRYKNYITTSEGESYAMLRAVWVDDQATFDRSWKWTKDNLQRPDHLFSWLFGRIQENHYGVLVSQGGQNTAADADTDIALALIFASARWNQKGYLAEAQQIISAIWENEVVVVRGKPYLVADNLEKTSQEMFVNPSYLAPYEYRIFAQVDPDKTHHWLALVDTSYEVLQKSIASPLDKQTSAGLPPDWVLLNQTTGEISAPRQSSTYPYTTDFGFDALRVPWRMYIDWKWFGEPRAKQVLASMSFLDKTWNASGPDKHLYTTYSHSGEPILKDQTAALYGGTLGYFMAEDPAAAKQIYDSKLQVLFNPDTNSWKAPLGYYDDNWTWFGIALYNDLIPNLLATSTNSTQE